MSDKWSILCLTTTCIWIWFLLGYSVLVIAYASYGMGHAKGAQCQYLDDTIWLANTTSAFCLFSNGDPDANLATAVKARCLTAMEDSVASITRAAEHSKCSSSVFAFYPPGTHVFWAGTVLFSGYWILFGFFLKSMVVPACIDTPGAEDELKELGCFDKYVNMKEESHK